MEKIKRKLIIENFVETTTFHGVFHVKTGNRWVRLIWLLIVFISAAFIILSTGLMVNKYLRYESYMITEETDVDRLKDIPNLLVCSSQKLAIVDSILEYSDAEEVGEENMSLVIDDIYMKKMRERVLEANKYSLLSCEIAIKDQLIDCIHYKRDIVFTFNGFCLLLDFQQLKRNSSILFKETNLLNYFNSNGAEFQVIFRNNTFLSESSEIYEVNLFEISDTESIESSEEAIASYSSSSSEYSTEKSKVDYVESFYFQLLDADCPHCIFNQLNNKLVFNMYPYHSSVKYYNVIPTYTEYSSSFSGRKCFDSNEAACHFDCLQRIIAELVRCKFVFDAIASKSNYLPYCSLSQLAQMEKIIQDYSFYKSKICDDECSPSCKSLNFEMNEEFGKGNSNNIFGFVWNFNLRYQVNRVKHIEMFAYTDLLNFINGLWSLFLGISVLSIWEIIELIYALLGRWNYLRKISMRVCSSNSTTKEPIKRLKTVFRSMFHETHLHGLKNVFSEHSSKSARIRWLIVILIASIGFSIAVKDATLEYLEYNSNIEKTMKDIFEDELVMNRKFEFLLCKSLVLLNQSQKEIYMQLDQKAKELFTAGGDVRDMKKIVYEYKKQMNITNENIVDLYEKTYSKAQLPFSVYALYPFIRINITDSPRYFYFDKICTRIQVNQTLEEWLYTPLFSFSHYGMRRDELNLSIYPEYQLNLFVLDTQSFHISEKSWYKTYSSLGERIPSIKANLKHKQLLQSPFRPSCNPTKDYRQHECYQECFNQIIFQVFQCKVIFGEVAASSNYCHPLMIPLIINYEKHILRNSYTNKCDHCKEPCDFFYYELEKEYNPLLQMSNNLQLLVKFEITKQKKVLLFEDTLIVIISLFSLFFGASILAFIQILYNVTLKFFKTQTELRFLRKMSILLDLVSNATTIHCAKYLSSKNRNDLKRLFWLNIIIIAISTAIAYCAIKIQDYQRSRVTIVNTELDEKSVMETSIHVDICTLVSEWDFEKYNPEIEYLNEFRMEFWKLDKFPSLYESFIFFRNNLSTQEEYQHLSKFKVSSLISNIIEKRFDSVYLLNGMEWRRFDMFTKLSNFNFTTTIHETNLFYGYASMNINLCKRVDWSQLQNRTLGGGGVFKNQFINVPENQLHILYDDSLEIFVEKYSLSTDNSRDLSGNLKRIKSFYKDYDYKHACKNKDSCVYSGTVLDAFSEHQLYLCNNELRDTVHALFNCTPFMTHTKHTRPECPLPYTLLIFYLMHKFQATLNKCEFSSARLPIEIDEFLVPEQLIATNLSLFNFHYEGIDLNGVKIYAQKVVEEYDLLQLMIDVSNWLNVLIGFSFITICELVFIVACVYKKQSKIDNLQQK